MSNDVEIARLRVLLVRCLTQLEKLMPGSLLVSDLKKMVEAAK